MLQEKAMVSIIIPVYNAEKNLKGALDSIVSQTYKNLEIVFVNDCSSDLSLNILENFKNQESEKYSIKILNHSENRGVAVARNTGLHNATGKYIYFIDSDDKMDESTIEIMINAAENNNMDIVGIEWFLSFAKNERYIQQPDVINGEDAFCKMCNGVMRWNLWLFLIKRDLLIGNDISFIPSMNMGEDMMVMMKLMMCTDRIKIIHKPLYHYNQNNTSSLTKKYFEARCQIEANVNEIEQFVLRKNKNVADKLNFLKLSLKLPLLISPNVEDYKKWEEWFAESNSYISLHKDVSLKTRILERFAIKRYYWFLKLYYYIAIKFLYGIIYK